MRSLGVLLLAALAPACALNRPLVKSLRDPGAAVVAFDQPIVTTITALNAVPSRCGPAFNRRVRDEEYRVYQVVGRIVRVKRELDRDVHIGIAEPDDPRMRMIVEIKDPGFRGNVRSPYQERLVEASRMFDRIVRESGVRQVRHLKGTLVRVTGVGFFDMAHFQIARSKSCIELHPVLAIERVLETQG